MTRSSNRPALAITRQREGWLLESELELSQPPHDVFPFFASTENLQQLTPSYLRFRILTPRVEIKQGAIIEYRLRLHGLPFTWSTKITEWDPPYRFIDTQIRGPYRWWIHEHQFLVQGSGTRAIDRVKYGIPWGRLLHPMFVRRDLQGIFQYRARILRQMFGEASAEG